ASFCRNAERGLFPDLQNRDCLWQLLVVITARKASHLRRDEGKKPTSDLGIEEIMSREPSPEFAAEVAEECQRPLRRPGDGRLDDGQLKSIALWKMEGYTNEEIAGKLGYVVRSIKRKLKMIRKIWEKESEP